MAVAGFLDKETRVVDMVLTGRGKELLSQGDLRFVYWAPFDDEVDYDPFVAGSASLSSVELSSSKTVQTEASLVREATTGYRRHDRFGRDTTNVHRPLFDMPQGQRILPRVTSSVDHSEGLEIVVKQRKIVETRIKRDQFGNVVEQLGPFDRGYERFEASDVSFEYAYAGGSFPADHRSEGFLVKVYRSGSDGHVKVDEKRDATNRLSYENDLIFSVSRGS